MRREIVPYWEQDRKTQLKKIPSWSELESWLDKKTLREELRKTSERFLRRDHTCD